jgi:hypothetical protein
METLAQERTVRRAPPAPGGRRARPRLRFGLRVAAGLLLAVVPPGGVSRAQDAASLIEFHIPAQELAAALDRFGAEAGVQIFYESSLARGRQSSPVIGRYSREEALLRLLLGTGLRARFTASGAVSIDAAGSGGMAGEGGGGPEAEAAGGGGGYSGPYAEMRLDTLRVEAPGGFPLRQRYGFYASSVRLQVRSALLRNEDLRSRTFQLQLNLWLDDDGRIARSALHRSSGVQRIDAAVTRALGGLVVRPEPPRGLPQPIHIEITSSGA